MSYSCDLSKIPSFDWQENSRLCLGPMRLKKAAILIAICNYSVSEAAFLVGFKRP